MIVIVKKKGQSKDAMFRQFTRTSIDENVVEDVKSRMFYKKPSLVRKEKEKERIKKRHQKISPVKKRFFKRRPYA
ncbi:30S ribosomal protein S21 [Candidatus Roizmanbacteria bacterium RIFCSPHIGHO2_12_FULL_41_11]|uniref:Small ribosomal subunit protein bS21 n=3 Tax=Candidatus Roizmaniibacteriota TaxID=1752723 RepID=A0A1F7JRN8_9BACT|nr:MAG: 30S ribosomal protein S21 [Candidatus Roizmanbacteria bacterium RIFCSPHIGHO2_12_FULL_41_11]OGK52374.1 MAG: 30S ribosomal protein S21 [Candidatus Roizmanbacteria bacterium RIFCSPLOWO2_01_FULL_41_22]OGK58272.1 MAG: 30S ribosomal protein S21 [Candidatus Roizmanbacteria bacterium RIFCSPLOWO2_02_FULL_41_9]